MTDYTHYPTQHDDTSPHIITLANKLACPIYLAEVIDELQQWYHKNAPDMVVKHSNGLYAILNKIK